MSNLVLSIDGRKEVHDRMRPYRGGQGSYEKIVPKFIKAAESRDQMDYYVRGTFTHNNLDFAEDVMHLAELGFKQISVEPVVAEEAEDYAARWGAQGRSESTMSKQSGMVPDLYLVTSSWNILYQAVNPVFEHQSGMDTDVNQPEIHQKVTPIELASSPLYEPPEGQIFEASGQNIKIVDEKR